MNKVFPNPFVGALVVKKGMVVGSGYHRVCGESHAEVIAIEAAGRHARGAELFVTLEPCSSYGKTPPCTDAIIKSGIRRVHFAAYDPNPSNRQRCKKILESSGIEVCYENMEEWHQNLNGAFIHNLKSQRPYIRLKLAMTLDGRISDAQAHSQWISGERSRAHVMKLRACSDAILVGKNTFVQDDPSLTIRHLKTGTKNYRDPDKVILFGCGRIPQDHQLVSKETTGRVLCFSEESQSGQHRKLIKNSRCQVLPMKGKNREEQLMHSLKTMKALGICSLFVEGGSRVISEFLNAGLADEMHLFMAPKMFGIRGKAGLSIERHIDSVTDTAKWKLLDTRVFEQDVYMRLKHV